MTEKEYNAILTLLGDPDKVVYEQVKNRLLQENTNIIAKLEVSSHSSDNTFFNQRINEIIAEISFGNIYKSLQDWRNTANNDLLKGAYLVNKLRFNKLEYKDLHNEIEKIKNLLKYELIHNFTPLEQIRAINHILYKVLKFSGSFAMRAKEHYFINKVLKTKKGSDISLAIIYLCVARRFGLPLYGIDMHQNFLLAYVNTNNNVIFYINPFNKGIVLGRSEIDVFLKHQKIKQKKSYYTPIDNNAIIKILIKNLINLSEISDKNTLLYDYEEINEIFSKD